MRRLALTFAAICALSLFCWLAHAQSSCRGYQDYECTDGFATYWVATGVPPALSSTGCSNGVASVPCNGVLYQDASAGHNIAFESDFGFTSYMMQAQSCGGSPQLFMTQSLTNGSFTCQSVSFPDITGVPTCAQSAGPFTGVISKPSGSCVTTFQNIGAHTIWANPTALSAPAAQTNIGTTMEFDGTGQMQNIGLRDGGGVNHVTTGTWPINSVIGTDVGGNIAAETALTCGQSEGPWTGIVSKGAGSCATGWQSIWPATANEILFSVNATSTPSADSRMAWDPSNHTIVLSGQAPAVDTMPLGISTAGNVQVFPLNTISVAFHASWVPNTFGSSIKWLMTTSDTPSSGSQIGYAGGMLFKYWRLTVNTDTFSVTSGGYSYQITINGSPLGSVAVSGLGASTNGGSTGSLSTTDSYGVRLNSSAASATTNLNSIVMELSQYPI